MPSPRRAALLLLIVLGVSWAFAQPGSTILRERQVLLERMNVPAWHRANLRGQGIKVAILDTGWRGYREHLGTTLPRTVQARSFRADGDLEARNSQHGILCAEVLHAIAPGSDLLLANWDTEQPATFFEAVRWARQQGARVIAVSVIIPTWSDNEGHSDRHRELQRLLGDEILLFAAAGNTAERHWTGPFAPDGRQYHQWRPGEIFNRLTPWEMERVSVEMMWQGDARYQLEVLDGVTGKPISQSVEGRDSQHAWIAARFVPEPQSSYFVRVQRLEGTPGRFHLVALGAMLQQSEALGSISFPGDGPEVIAVGAISAEDQRLAYSACGREEGLSKPDFVATVPFPSVWRTQPFTGTSAATPQAAAVAALVWGRHSNWSASQIRETLTKSARRLSRENHDPGTGYGQIRLPNLDRP